LAEQWIRSARSVSPYDFENQPNCCDAMKVDNNNNNNNYYYYYVTMLWNQAVHTDREVTANRPDIIIKTKERKYAH